MTSNLNLSALSPVFDDSHLPDPDLSKITVRGSNILLRPVGVKAKTEGGILLPDSMRQDYEFVTTVGRVVQISETAYNPKYCGDDDFLKIGDYVGWVRTHGQKILTSEGVLLILLPYEAVQYTLTDPDFIDTNGFNQRK